MEYPVLEYQGNHDRSATFNPLSESHGQVLKAFPSTKVSGWTLTLFSTHVQSKLELKFCFLESAESFKLNSRKSAIDMCKCSVLGARCWVLVRMVYQLSSWIYLVRLLLPWSVKSQWPSPISQLIPPVPDGQVHVYRLSRLLQMPPFWQGELAHSSTSLAYT